LYKLFNHGLKTSNSDAKIWPIVDNISLTDQWSLALIHAAPAMVIAFLAILLADRKDTPSFPPTAWLLSALTKKGISPY
jgi:hypothetical protein